MQFVFFACLEHRSLFDIRFPGPHSNQNGISDWLRSVSNLCAPPSILFHVSSLLAGQVGGQRFRIPGYDDYVGSRLELPYARTLLLRYLFSHELGVEDANWAELFEVLVYRSSFAHCGPALDNWNNSYRRLFQCAFARSPCCMNGSPDGPQVDLSCNQWLASSQYNAVQCLHIFVAGPCGQADLIPRTSCAFGKSVCSTAPQERVRWRQLRAF